MYSPFFSLTLVIMLLLVSLNYWSTSGQNKDLHRRNQKQQQANDHLQEKIIELTNHLDQAQKRQDQLKKSEAELEKCFKENMEIKSVRMESNMSHPQVDDLVEKIASYQEENTKMKKEIESMKEEVELKDARSVELGKRLKQLRDQMNANKELEIKEVIKTIGEDSAKNKTILMNVSRIIENTDTAQNVNLTALNETRSRQNKTAKNNEDKPSTI